MTEQELLEQKARQAQLALGWITIGVISVVAFAFGKRSGQKSNNEN